MSAVRDGINKHVERVFTRPDPAVTVRRTLVNIAFTALVFAAAFSLEPPLSYAFYAWAVLRCSLFFFLSLGSKAIDEKMRRLEALPPEYLRFLRTGKP